MFPQSMAKKFAELGIDVHDPRFGAWWERSSHLRNAHAYNLKWHEFFERAPTQQGAYDLARQLAAQHGLTIHF